MRVLHLLYEPARSGISRHVLELVRLLPGIDHEVILPDHLVEVADDLTAAGAAVHPARIRSRLLPRSTAWTLPRLVRRIDPDVLHLHALESGLFGSLTAHLARARRLVFSPQTLEISKRPLLPLYLALLRVTARRATWIVTSAGHARKLRAYAAPGRVYVVPNAVPIRPAPPTRQAARRRLGWAPDAFVAACVARLSRQKDPLTFVRAAAREPELRFALIGDGPLRAEVEAAGRGLPNLQLHGYLDGVEEVYAGADVLCLASRWEGMSLTLLSALASGVATVASRIDGNTDLVEHERTGLLVDPGDAVGLARAVRRLADDPALARRLGEAGREHVEATCSLEVVRARMLEIYRAVAKS